MTWEEKIWKKEGSGSLPDPSYLEPARRLGL